MGCFVRGGKSLWDILNGVSKNGMGCFVPGCFVRLPFIKYLYMYVIILVWISITSKQNVKYMRLYKLELFYHLSILSQ